MDNNNQWWQNLIFDAASICIITGIEQNTQCKVHTCMLNYKMNVNAKLLKFDFTLISYFQHEFVNSQVLLHGLFRNDYPQVLSKFIYVHLS